MLIATIEELNQHTQIGLGNSYETFSVDLEQAEQDYLRPLLGDDLYTQLLDDYDANSITSDPDLTLLALSQSVIANMAVSTNLDQRQVNISDSGVLKNGEDAYHYQKVDAQNHFKRRAYRAAEQILVFLEREVANYPDWRNSNAYYLDRSYLIPTAKDFQQHYNIKSSRRTYLAMRPVMKRVQVFSLVETLGQAFYDELIKTVQNDNALPSQQKADNRHLLDTYLRPAIAYLTVSEAMRELSMQLDADGLYLEENLAISNKTVSKKQASTDQVAMHAQQAADTGNQYLSRAVAYLNQNASDSLYASYRLSQTYIAEQSILNTKLRPDAHKDAPGKLYGF